MNPLWSNIFSKSSKNDSLAYFLSTVAVFADLNKKDLQFIESLVHVRRYSSGETVFSEGDIGSGMYIVRSGRVMITMRDMHLEEQELAQLGPRDFFGETTLTAPRPRSASARAVGNTELVGLFRADLLDAVHKHPATSSRILLGLSRVLSERLQAAALQLREHQNVSFDNGDD